MLNPYLEGAFAPVSVESTVERESLPLQVIGELPRDLNGLYVRNGPNPALPPKGRYHWFDGDGMVHGVHFEDGSARYTNRYVATAGLAADIDHGAALWRGVAEPRQGNPDDGNRLHLKDTSNTDLVYHAGALTSLWYLAGEPYRLDPHTLKTLGPDDWRGTRRSPVSAHAKVDDRTGELLFFDYGPQAPFMHYGVVSAERELVTFEPIALRGPRMPHDMAVTERYSVLMDLPLFVDPEAHALGRHRLVFRHDMPSRFAVIPRHGKAADIRWFDAEPCFIYHSVNAWDDGDDVVMIVCRFRWPKPLDEPITGPLANILNYLRLDAQLWEYRFNLATGATRERALDDRSVEFPTINNAALGTAGRFAYVVTLENTLATTFDGFIKYDVTTGAAVSEHRLEPGQFGSEGQFAPRTGARSEDDGYMLSFISDMANDRSSVFVFDAADLGAGPVAEVRLPRRVPNGFHGCWVDAAALPARS